MPRTHPRDWQLAPTLLLGLIVLVLASFAALWWWTGTGASLQWAIARASLTQPITVQGASGSLRTGASIASVAWERDGLRVEASKVEFAWRPIFLLSGTLKLARVHADGVRITDQRPPPAEPARAPLSLAIPVQVDLDDLSVGRIEWITGHAVTGENLAGRYWFDGKAHWLRVDKLTWAGASYQGQASVGAAAPLPVDATVSGALTAPVPGAQQVPVEFKARVTGPIADLTARAQVVAMPQASQGSQPSGSQATHATATARITPWAAQPLPEAQATLAGLNLASLWPQAPRTGLSGSLRVVPAGTDAWQVLADLRNAPSGPWDKGLLPVSTLQARGEWRAGTVLVQSLDADAAGGRVQASGRWQPGVGAREPGWVVNGTVTGVDPAALHTRLAAAPLGGKIDARQEGDAIAFDADLRIARAGRRVSSAARTDERLSLQVLKAQGRWSQGVLSLPRIEAVASDARATGSLQVRIGDRSGSGRLQVQAPGLRAEANGNVSERQGAGQLSAQVPDLAQARAWLARLPGVAFGNKLPLSRGSTDLSMAWQGGWRDPVLNAHLNARRVELLPGTAVASASSPPPAPARDAASPAPAWSADDLSATLNGRLSDAAVTLRANARQGERIVALDTSGRAGVQLGRAHLDWRATVTALTVGVRERPSAPGGWRLELQGPLQARGSGVEFDVRAGSAMLTAPPVAGKATAPATLTWDALRRRAGELRTAGRLHGLPMSWLELVHPQWAGSALTGDMVFDAQWDASLGSALRLDASLVRTAGDITVLADSETGAAQRVAAGVRDARVTVSSRGDQVTATLQWNSERAGAAEGRVITRLSPGGTLGWEWAGDAPIDGTLRARLPRLAVWSLLAPPGWRLRGSLDADVRATGTRAAPRLGGTLAADELALRSVVDGIELNNGRLRAQLEGERVRITEFTLRGAGEGGAGGTLSATGEGAWVDGAPRLRAVAELTRLRASIRSDRELTVSGRLEASLQGGSTEIRGKLKVDRASILLPEEIAPRLGDDVVVRGSPEFAGTVKDRKADTAQERETKRPLDVAVDLDLGDDFRVSGRGLRTRVAGTLAVSAQSIMQPRLTGTIRTVGGDYRAYGQRLDIERGVMRFSGAAGNPGLDILAVRPNITQRVGVLITGTALAPFVRLYAEPDLPDAEKLAWLVTGRAAPATGAEAALVQQAALALLANRRPGSTTFASRIGLDELSVRRDGSAGAIVTVGKRFADNFYASFERSLSGALGTLYIFYDVSSRLTVRGQAGDRAGVDLIYTFRFD